MALPLFFLIWLAGFGLTAPLTALAEPDLSMFLPRTGQVEGWTRSQRLDRARGEELFALINGGAEVFLRHGFVSYAATDYQGSRGGFITLELYGMGDPAGAEKVFGQKAGDGLRKVDIGGEAALGDYYLLFRSGRFLAILVGQDSKEETRRGLKALARASAQMIDQGR